MSPELIDALHFDDDSIINDKIHAKSSVEDHALVFKAHDPLPLDMKPLLLERAGQNGLVHGFHADPDPGRDASLMRNRRLLP